MAKAKKTQYAILGLLNIRPMTGYDIKKYIENTIGYFWNENYGAIYPMLKKLCQEELITKKEIENDTTPNSKLYTITDKGNYAFINWLKAKVNKEKIRDELSLKLFFGSNLSVEENINRLLEEKKENESLLIILKDFEAMIAHLIKNNAERYYQLNYQLMTVLRGKFEIIANIEWCVHCLKMLEDMKE